MEPGSGSHSIPSHAQPGADRGSDRVVTHALFLGTNDGELMGMPPSGRAVRLHVIHVDTVKDGLIHDEFAVLDLAALMERLQAT